MHKTDREQGIAKTALALMDERDIAATPDNFELFYAYASGASQAAAQALGGLIAARKPITPEMLLELRLRCLSSARAASAMDSFGSGLGDVIGNVLGKLETAGQHTVDYKKTLSAASGALGGAGSPDDLRALVSGLITATREMEQRTKTLEGELQRSSEQVRDLNSTLDNVRRESLTDPLTNIANRKAFDDAVRAAVTREAPQQEPVTLLICDIDHFKKFNDSFGHQTGDQVLRLVASCLTENVKGRDTAARYGGEEFGVVLRGTSLEDATKVADQIRQTVEAKKLVKKSTGDVLGSITISIGVAEFAPGEDAETVIRRADACLYGAKSHGRNMVINENDPRIAALESSAA